MVVGIELDATIQVRKAHVVEDATCSAGARKIAGFGDLITGIWSAIICISVSQCARYLETGRWR